MSTVGTSDSFDHGNVSFEPRRLALNVTKDALRQVRAGHPWVFDGSITRIKAPAGTTIEEARPGDLAVIFDDKRRFAAIGLYDPDSPIRVRVLHSGSPAKIDEEFFAERVVSAAQIRFDTFDDSDTSGFRLVHGENDGLPGFVVDRFGEVAVIKLYTPAWFPYLPMLTEIVRQVCSERPAGCRSVVVRLARSVDRMELGFDDGSVLHGDGPDGPVVFRENGLRFEAEVFHGHKTGFFLDQRDNRRMVRSLSRGSDVLDVFSFSGGFSVSAAAGGATSVHSVDINPWALEATERNLALNRKIGNVRRCRHDSTLGDAREVMERFGREKRRFDLVVVDPPSFASSRGQVRGALRSYGELTASACRLVESGGTLFQASCSARVDKISFRQTVIESAYHAGFELVDVRETGQPVDHPVSFAQGEYLKGILATVRRRR